MENDNTHLDNTVIATLKNKDHSILSEQMDTLTCTHSDIIELLAEYIVLSDKDDESFDQWYDGLCPDKLKVLKGFEIIRAHLENQ